MKKYIKHFTFIFICFVSIFMFGVDKVDADMLCGSSTKPISGESISCDYDFFNGAAKGTLVFTNSSNNGYCATVGTQNYGKWGLGWLVADGADALVNFTTSKTIGVEFFEYTNSELKGKVSFDVSKSTIKDAIKNKKCPTIKMVHGYSVLSGETDQVVYSDDTGGLNAAACGISYIASAGSECAVNNGYNLTELSVSQTSKTIKEQQAAENTTCDTDCINKIKTWGSEKSNKSSNSNTEVNSCNVISADLSKTLSNAFFYISVAGIIILVVMSLISGVKVITAGEDDALKNFFKGIRVRIICLIVLLLLPTLVSFTISTVNNVAKIWGVNSNDPLCGVK